MYSFFNLGARWGWVVNAAPAAALQAEIRQGAHCTVSSEVTC